MSHRSIAITVFLCSLFACSIPAAAQETNDELSQLWEQLDQNNARLSELQTAGRPTSEEEMVDRIQQLVALDRQRLAIANQIVEPAVAKFAAAPNPDDETTEKYVTLVKLLVANDYYEPGYRLAKSLVDAGVVSGDLYDWGSVAAYSSDHYDDARQLAARATEQNVTAQISRHARALDATAKAFETEKAIRAAEAEADDLPRVAIETNAGNIVIELFENEAPETVANFVSLVEKGFYDGLIFHRVLGRFMCQGGDPDGTGSGGPGYDIYCECHKDNYRRHFAGTISMAHAGRDTGGSQFFLTLVPTPFLDGKHTAFGRVIEGLDVLPRIQKIDPQRKVPGVEPSKIIKASVIRKREHEYVPNKVK